MFERYDEPARRVIFFARHAAGVLGAAEIDAEHLLLGLLRQDQPLLDRLAGASIDVESVHQRVRNRRDGGESKPDSDEMPVGASAKRVLVNALDEADLLNHKRIGTEHLLLGLLAEEASFAAEILGGLGLSSERVREHLIRRDIRE